MPTINYKRRRTNIRSPRAEVIHNFVKGQDRQFGIDKSEPDTFQKLLNFLHEGGDAVLRRGIEQIAQLTGTKFKNLHILKTATDDKLMATRIDSDTEISLVEIDRNDYTVTDVETALDNKERYFEDLRGAIFHADGVVTNVRWWDGAATGAVVMDYGSGARPAKFLASDMSRMWATVVDTPEELLVFSNDRGANALTSMTFNAGGSANLDRAGVAQSKITKFTSLLGVNRSVVAFGRSRVEVHEVPYFAASGLTSFPANISTLKRSNGQDMAYDNIGIANWEARVAVQSYCFFLADDAVLYRLDTRSGQLKAYEHFKNDELDVSNAAMAYDIEKDLIYCEVRESNGQSLTIVFNVLEENFSQFDNIKAVHWATDQDNNYFIDSTGRMWEAFNDAQLTDNGLSIEWEAITQAKYADIITMWKKCVEFFLHTQVWEDTLATIDFLSNRAVGSNATSSDSLSRESTFVANILGPNPQSMGQGVFGGAAVTYDEEVGTERIWNNDKVNHQFVRYELRVRGKSRNRFRLKGVGIKYEITNRKVKDLIFS